MEQISMYRVIISDDEKRICKLIRNLIDWKSLNTEIVGISNDGISTLKMINEMKPDIVITDIRMPGYDGLELIRRIREQNLDTDFIILSGYQQFDYARSAIRYGVEDYLLKPLSEKELVEAVRKIVSRRDKENSNIHAKLILEEEVRRNQNWVRKDYFSNVISVSHSTDSSISRTLPGFESENGKTRVILIKPDIDCSQENVLSYHVLLNKCDEIIEQSMKDTGLEYITAVKDEGVFLIFSYREEISQEIPRLLKNIIKSILPQKALFPHLVVTSGISRERIGTEDVRLSVKEAESAVLNRLVTGCGTIIEADSLSDCKYTANDIFTASRRKALMKTMEVLDTDALSQIIANMKEDVLKAKGIDGSIIRSTADAVFDFYEAGMKSTGLWKEEKEVSKMYHEIFNLCQTSSQVFDQLSYLLNNDLSGIRHEKNQSLMKPIRMVMEYLQQHYNEPVRLEDMSEMVGFNSTYFSSLFKKETGENFSDYLIALRVRRAKELLTDTEMKIADIADEVGYLDLKYFTKIFKRSAGVNPSDYRKLYHRIG